MRLCPVNTRRRLSIARSEAMSALSILHSLCIIQISKSASKAATVADGVIRQANDAKGTDFITYYLYPDIII